MKSSSAGVGPLQILEHEHDRLASAIRSKNSRQAENRSSWSRRAPLGEAEQVREPRLDATRAPRRRARCSRATRRASRGAASGSSSSRDPRAHAHHLGERPERDAVAVREAAAAVPAARRPRARRCTSRTPRRAATCRCRRCRRSRRAARAAPRAQAWKSSLTSRNSRVAADERRLEAGRATLAAARGDHPQRAPELDRLGLALELVEAGVLVSDRGLASPAGSPRRRARVPGSAADWIRDAVLTRSPATMPWPWAPTVTAASPVRTPARRRRLGDAELVRSAGDGRDQIERGPDRSLGVVLVRGRRAPDGHHRVADELLHRAAVPLDEPRAGVEVARQELADLLRVAGLRRAP